MTLIELMVVIVLLGILAAAAAPTVRRSIERAAAKGNAREVANALRMARNQAMSRGEVLGVRITAGTPTSRGKIDIFRSGDLNGVTTTETDSTGNEVPTTAPGDTARNCRQLPTSAEWNSSIPVHTTTLEGRSGRSIIAAVDPHVSGVLDLCFSPDGRVLLPGTATVPVPDKFDACDENAVLIVADHGVTLGTESFCGGATDPPLDPVTLRDQRDALNLYRVVVSYNGSIKVEQ